MTMELPSIAFSVTGLTCFCKNLQCTLPPNYSGIIDSVFINKKYFIEAEGDLSKAFSLAVNTKITDELKTIFNCKTNVSGNSDFGLPNSFSVTTDCDISPFIYDEVQIKNNKFSDNVTNNKGNSTKIYFDIMNEEVIEKKLFKCPQ